ncbi:uncharacterized protein LOC123976200 isoform X3 [Micropterus dolomieu]|uniref:uncharacterized protein LOC123976200 isoform X3 n=1 Tax=Micropterus dolomieu TaxID=147949 RepID=UPI001E8CE814|nr:uncharacterized protein LOC123976200 isoform X3 [Micropterus dolomieu]
MGLIKERTHSGLTSALNERFKGISTKSQLFDSLEVYLNNKNRLQPIIGLGSIIECMKAGAQNKQALYLCEVCVCRLSKADMRNHITGSLHRYNYIKAWHPHLVSEWKDKFDLSKLAWPLMKMAKILEEKEGPGDVQLLEVEDATYQKMATHTENNVVTLINILRYGQGQGKPENHSETTSVLFKHNPIHPQRIVLPPQNQRRQSKKSLRTSAETNKPPSLIQSTLDSIKAEDWLSNMSVSLLDNTPMSAEPSVLSEKSSSFIDSYTGTEPLIGLFRLVECRGEDGHTYCFLCHCCRIKSTKKDIIDHLTSSSHLMNYLMESHPEQVDVMMADIKDNDHILLSLAKKVEQEEGRGELKVVNAPESLCIQLTGKSYHWCIKMLCNDWTHTKIQKAKIAVKGPSMNKTSNQGIPEKCAKRRRSRRKTRKVSNTVFKVSLPLTKGAVLLERTSLSVDSFPVSSAYSPSLDSDLIPLPESQSEDCEAGSFAVNHAEHTSMGTTPQLQQDLYIGHAGAGQYMGPEITFTVRQEVNEEANGYFNDNQYFNQPEDITEPKDKRFYEPNEYNRQHNSEERSSKRFYNECQNEGPQTHNKGLSAAAPHTQDWLSYDSSSRIEKDYTEQWYNSGTRVKVPREERPRETSADATQHYYQQWPQYQDMTQEHTSLWTGGVEQHTAGELAPHFDAVRINMHPRFGDSLAHSCSIAPEPRAQFLEIEQRQLQTYMEFTIGHVPIAPHSNMTQTTAHQATQVGHVVMSNPNYNTGPWTNPDHHLPHPVGGGDGHGMYRSNAFIPPGQALNYGAHSDPNFRATGL